MTLALRDFFNFPTSVFDESQWPTVASFSSVAPAKCNFSENDKEFKLEAEFPGVPKDNIKVDFDHNVLTVSGEVKTEKEETEPATKKVKKTTTNGKDEKEEDVKYHKIERTHQSYSRSVRLPAGVDSSKIQANYKDGLLVVTVPKPAPAAAIKSSITVN